MQHKKIPERIKILSGIWSNFMGSPQICNSTLFLPIKKADPCGLLFIVLCCVCFGLTNIGDSRVDNDEGNDNRKNVHR